MVMEFKNLKTDLCIQGNFLMIFMMAQGLSKRKPKNIVLMVPIKIYPLKYTLGSLKKKKTRLWHKQIKQWKRIYRIF